MFVRKYDGCKKAVAAVDETNGWEIKMKASDSSRQVIIIF